MARPKKSGIEYFPFDVGFFRDKKVKLIKGEFGAKGLLVLLHIMCSIYEDEGYYKSWDADDCYLMSDDVGCGCTSQLIGEVVEGCVRRGLFDETVFDMFSILTSRGIQRRYLRGVETRDSIEIIQEYWLLDNSDKKDVPTGILNKITFRSQSPERNGVNLERNEIDCKIYPQSKVKDSKEKDSRAKERKEEHSAASGKAAAPAGQKHRYGEYSHVLLTDPQRDKLFADYGELETLKAITYLDEYIQMKGYKAKDHNLAIRRWVFKALEEERQRNERIQPRQNQSLEQAVNVGKEWLDARRRAAEATGRD